MMPPQHGLSRLRSRRPHGAAIRPTWPRGSWLAQAEQDHATLAYVETTAGRSVAAAEADYRADPAAFAAHYAQVAALAQRVDGMAHALHMAAVTAGAAKIRVDRDIAS